VVPTVTELDDAGLARRIIDAAPERDVPAEGQLYARLAPRVRLFGLKHLRSEHAAADLVQDVLLMTLDKLRTGDIREPERIVSFVLGSCRQTVVDWRRGQTRRERLLNAYAVDVIPEASEDSPALDQARLRHCLQHLAERERTVVLMSFYDDRSADEVARELGLAAGNVRVIRYRALEHLRDCMNPEGHVV
jgi:RNA polymerase sigma-70 factor (ECF subfamily)